MNDSALAIEQKLYFCNYITTKNVSDVSELSSVRIRGNDGKWKRNDIYVDGNDIITSISIPGAKIRIFWNYPFHINFSGKTIFYRVLN